MMNNRFFKINEVTRFIESITLGAVQRPGYEAVEQTDELRHVRQGWSYINGQFTDTTDAYRALVANSRSLP